MKRFKRLLALMICLMLMIPANVWAVEDDSSSALGKDADVQLTSVNITNGAQYGAQAGISFNAVAKGATINSITPVINDEFSFETNEAAYAVTEGNAETLGANYTFTVRQDVSTGYHPITFRIEYTKNAKAYYIDKIVNIQLTGKPAATEAPAPEKPAETQTSTPRLMVTGFETNPAKVMAGQNFTLTVHLKNTSNKTAVNNMKVSLTTAENEILPTSGSSTKFIQSLSSGGTTDVTIEMRAQATLDQKPYTLAVACEYEDNSANPFTSTENISIPVYQEAKIKLTDITIAPETLMLYDQGDIMFNINNMGKGILYNVQVSFEGDTIEAEPAYIGNIAAGAIANADVMVNAVAVTEDEGKIKAIITYEDASGEQQTYEEEIDVFVMEAMEDDTSMKEEMPVEEEQGTSKIGLIITIIVIVILVAIVVAIVLIRKSKKRKLEKMDQLDEEEIEEDELS